MDINVKSRKIWQQVQKVRWAFRLRPYDASTPDGRSKERYRRVALTATSSILAKAISISTALISAPLTIKYLGTERYGLWMTVASVITVINFADMGIGNGLVNAVVAAQGHNDRREAQRSISSAFFMFGAIAAVIVSVFGCLYPFVPWARVFNVSSPLAIAEAGPAVAVFIGCFALSLPFGVVQRVQLGLQEGFQSNLWQCAASVFGLALVIVAILLRLGLPWLVLAMSGSTAFVLGLNWAVQFYHDKPWLKPSLLMCDRKTSYDLLASGSVFFLLQFLALISFASDNIVLAQMMGPDTVTVFSVVQRLFSVTMLTQLFINPLWPAFGDALERGEYAWARRTFMRAMVLGLAATLAVGGLLVVAAKHIIVLWIGPQVVPPTILVVAMAFWWVFATYSGTLAVVLNNRMLLHKQLAFYAPAALASLALKIVLTPVVGISGVIWATLIGFGIFYVVPAARLVRLELWKDRNAASVLSP